MGDVVYIGMGPMNGVARDYEASLDSHFDKVLPALRSWWRTSGPDKELEIIANFFPDERGGLIRIINGRERVYSSIRRRPKTTHSRNPVELARRDILNLIEELFRRFEITTKPAFPERDEVAHQIQSYELPDDI